MRYMVAAEAVRDDGLVDWKDAARWLLEVWPVRSIIAVLGPAADLLPEGLQPIDLLLTPPVYALHALRVQWRNGAMPHLMVRRDDFADYLVDLLLDAIDPATVDLLRHDEEFMRAYAFPEGEEV